MEKIFIGIGGIEATNDSNKCLKTMALGSCVGVVLHYPKTKTMGMVHIALPDSDFDTGKAKNTPGYFADTGIPALLNQMIRINYKNRDRDIFAKIAGGASKNLSYNDSFGIGKRNIEAVRFALSLLEIPVIGEDTGGTISRTLSAIIDTGKVIISSGGKSWEI
jgi:chemotaxis protein CheD